MRKGISKFIILFPRFTETVKDSVY
jgi:hypothetical protein